MFIITKDLISDGHDVGLMGPRGLSDESMRILREVESPRIPDNALPFRMLDDDGELYYLGYWIDSGPGDDHEPLDCFGSPNAGCTEIQYADPAT